MGDWNLPYIQRYGRFKNLQHFNLSYGRFNYLPYLSYGRFIILPYDKLYSYGRYLKILHLYLIYGTINGTYGIKCMIYGSKYIKYMV